jgi:cell division protein FtsB
VVSILQENGRVISILKKVPNGILWFLPVLFFLGLVFLVSSGYREMQAMKQMAQKREALIRYNQELNQKNEEMYRKITRLKQDPLYLEEVARSEFGLVKPDEIIFFIDQGSEKEKPRNGTGIQSTTTR